MLNVLSPNLPYYLTKEPVIQLFFLGKRKVLVISHLTHHQWLKEYAPQNTSHPAPYSSVFILCWWYLSFEDCRLHSMWQKVWFILHLLDQTCAHRDYWHMLMLLFHWQSSESRSLAALAHDPQSTPLCCGVEFDSIKAATSWLQSINQLCIAFWLAQGSM